MKKRLFVTILLLLVATVVFADGSTSYDGLFESIYKITDIARTLGVIVLTLSLIAQGIVTFFGNNMSEVVKATMGRVATGGCFIGGATVLATFILGSSS